MQLLQNFSLMQFTFFLGNDTLDKAVKSREAQDNFQQNPQVSNRLVSFSRNFFKNIQEEIEKIQQRPRH